MEPLGALDRPANSSVPATTHPIKRRRTEQHISDSMEEGANRQSAFKCALWGIRLVSSRFSLRLVVQGFFVSSPLYSTFANGAGVYSLYGKRGLARVLDRALFVTCGSVSLKMKSECGLLSRPFLHMLGPQKSNAFALEY